MDRTEQIAPPASTANESIDKKEDVTYEHAPLSTLDDHVTNVGEAIIQQRIAIPQAGSRKRSDKWEYWTYTLFCELVVLIELTLDFHSANVALGNYGGATQQSLVHQKFPNGLIKWGGSLKPRASQVPPMLTFSQCNDTRPERDPLCRPIFHPTLLGSVRGLRSVATMDRQRCVQSDVLG